MERQEASGAAAVSSGRQAPRAGQGSGSGPAAGSAIAASATRPHKETDDR